MRRIQADTPPPEHRAYRAMKTEYEEWSLDAIRRALWKEQGGRCAYCERRIRDLERIPHRTKIEHFHPRSARTWTTNCSRCSGAEGSHDAPTKWSNLLLCCDGQEAAGTGFTCDKSKEHTDICADFQNPKRWRNERLVIVRRDGRVAPEIGLPAGAQGVLDTVLNLNTERLTGVRKAVMASYLREYERKKAISGGLTPRQRENAAARLRDMAEAAEYSSVLLTVADRIMPRNTTRKTSG